MPGKHVHFVDAPSTPSSTFSASTLSSSSGPATPPPAWYSPPTSIKSSFGSPYLAHGVVPVTIHPVLMRIVGHGTPLQWDLSQSPDYARPALPHLPSHINDALVREPATFPALPSLAIICDYLPWMITVQPTPEARWAAPYVTVGDVLFTLNRALRLGVTDAELSTLEPAQRDRVHDAYVRRYRRVEDAREREKEKEKYIKRVDFLREHRAFLGLAPVPGGLPAKGLAPGVVWALHVA